MEIKKHQLKPELRQLNVINKNDKLFLSIQIGNGQIGGSKITFGSEQLAKGSLAQPTFIGNCDKFLDKEIEIETNVLDVNHFTNMCVITTTFLNQENKVLYTKIDNGDAPENGIASFKGKYKLILTAFLLLFTLFNTHSIFSQTDKEKTIKFENLETPSSPGFILLDKTPSSIEKPTTPQGFGINLLGLLQGTGGAIEFTPFWLINHPNLTAQKMNNNKTPILYNLAVSAATVKTDSTTYISVGFRTRLLQIYKEESITNMNKFQENLENLLADLDTTKISKLQKDYSQLIGRPIITLDIAGALGGGSDTNSFNNAILARWSTWLSFNWRPKGDDFYVTTLARYIYNKNFEDYVGESDLLDIGTRINYDISRFCISLEYLQRFNLTNNDNSDNRVATIGSYKFSDNLFLTATFGKNFSNVNNIIALAGINFGISNSKVKAY